MSYCSTLILFIIEYFERSRVPMLATPVCHNALASVSLPSRRLSEYSTIRTSFHLIAQINHPLPYYPALPFSNRLHAYADHPSYPPEALFLPSNAPFVPLRRVRYGLRFSELESLFRIPREDAEGRIQRSRRRVPSGIGYECPAASDTSAQRRLRRRCRRTGLGRHI